MTRSFLVALVALAISLAVPPGVLAQAPTRDKLDPALRAVVVNLVARGVTRANARERGASRLSTARVRVDSDARIQVYVHLLDAGVAEFAALGDHEVDIELVNETPAIVQGWAPFDRIEAIAALPFVKRVTPPRYGLVRAGGTTTEGDVLHRANELRALGVDGSGTRVGVISDGANDLAAAQASSDLPADITVFGSCTARDEDGASCDPGSTCNEGTAMLEIVHDIAPGARLAVGAASTTLEFVQRLASLVDDFGADVIIDDIVFYGEPWFEDGLVAKAVADAADRVVYVSAAGNGADGHYEAQYLPGFDGSAELHDFGASAGGPTDVTMDFLVEPGDAVLTVLQWNDRYGSSSNDYDLYLLDADGIELLCPTCGSADFQDGGGDPLEAACYFNDTTETVRGKIVIERFDGSPRRLEVFLLGSAATGPEEYDTPAGSVVGHAAVENALAVGAIDAADPGTDDIEPYSSLGPSRVDFPFIQSRAKPDLAAVDGVSISGAGGFPTTFFGTSAAAPHVGAIAAQLIQVRPDLTPGAIRNALTRGAVDLGPFGRDDTFGFGRVDARDALAALGAAATTVIDLPTNDLVYDSARELIHASVPASAGSNPNTITTIDPVAGTVVASTFIGTNPNRLAISDDGTWLYASIEGDARVRRLHLASRAAGLDFALGADGTSTLRVEDIEVLPGNPDAVAISRRYLGISPRHAGVAVYDLGVPRPTTTPGHTGSNVIEFSASASVLYGYNNETTDFGLRRMAVDASGVSVSTVTQGVISGFGVDIELDGGLINTTSGRLVDPAAGTLLGVYEAAGPVEPDAGIGVVYYLYELDGEMLHTFDRDGLTRLDSQAVDGISGTPGSLVRWRDGVAFRTSGGQVFLVSFDPDRDGITEDNCPSTVNPLQQDLDEDGTGDACDDDEDGDGVPNASDPFPRDASESRDTDGDGIGDNADTDDDNDGLTDAQEAVLGTNPLVRDTDGDGLTDGQEVALGRNPKVNEAVVVPILLLPLF